VAERQLTEQQAEILAAILDHGYVTSGRNRDPDAHVYSWVSLNFLRRQGLVIITHHPDTGKRIATITQAGRDSYARYTASAEES
jgi:hypothetical protein